MGETPIFDELEAKWSEVVSTTTLCDPYNTFMHLQTGATWYEDDEGNEVFPEVHAYLVPQEVRPEVTIRYLGEVEQPKRKFKLLGRNQDCNGCL